MTSFFNCEKPLSRGVQAGTSNVFLEVFGKMTSEVSVVLRHLMPPAYVSGEKANAAFQSKVRLAA